MESMRARRWWEKTEKLRLKIERMKKDLERRIKWSIL